MAQGEGAKKLAENVTETITNSGKGFFSSILAVIAGLGKGVWGGTVGNIPGLLMTALTCFGMVKLAPDVVKWLPLKVGGKKVGQQLMDHIEKGGDRAMLMDVGLAALAINGTIGGLSGVFGETMGNISNKDTGGMGKVGSVLGTAAVLGGIGLLAFKAVKSNDIGYAGTADIASAQKPDNLPAKPPATGQQAAATLPRA